MTPSQPPAAPRQTLSFLKGLLEARGLRPNHRLGQNFLIDLNLLDLIARTAELDATDVVLEVGCGTGSLTGRLAASAGAVLAVEIDPGFLALARDLTAIHANVEFIQGDILKNKNTLNPAVVDRLRTLRAQPGRQRLKLVANLPYVVATPVIANLLLSDLDLERIVTTVQWELAARFAARPSTSDYGVISVLAQALADVTVVRRLPPSAFWPRPKVESGILLIVPNADKRAAVGDVASFHRFIHKLYQHRRKNLRGALLPHLSDHFTKPALDEVLARHGFDPACRAESLDVADHLRLWRAFEPQ
ncbi:MAG TPA: 16S rRNA (adenine(1518)-N(6)/adenine(1519)-N(6))-dimethyltransferase RsmA [Gemmatales bacterium]|nr:16S rRNA (adenine(1518)-N(6)/adenine(1519)-N(6))-dimethyltransferase RsmA [Gemmatales bacterium]